MNKSNPIGVRFNTELLNYLKDMDKDITPQKALSIYEECFMREFSLFGQKPIKQIHIYKLINPIKNEVFYIGRTTFMLNQRLTNHVGQRRSKCQGVNQRKNEVINQIIDAGEMPKIELIETIHPLDDSEYNGHHDREVYWIAKSLLDGEPLVNKIPERTKDVIKTIKENNKPENKKRILTERNPPLQLLRAKPDIIVNWQKPRLMPKGLSLSEQLEWKMNNH